MTQPHSPPPFGEQQPPPFYRRPWFVVPAGLLAVAVLGLVVGGTATEKAPEAVATQSPTAASPAPTSSAPTTQSPEPAPSTASSGVDFVMPDVVGMDLQSAQNLIQDHGVFLTVSHDLLGSRNQAIDSNWQVCDQNVPPGQQVTGEVEGDIDFGVVKREESCP